MAGYLPLEQAVAGLVREGRGITLGAVGVEENDLDRTAGLEIDNPCANIRPVARNGVRQHLDDPCNGHRLYATLQRSQR